MPGKNFTFTTRVDPDSPPSKKHLNFGGRPRWADVFMVEAPGTAPGSATLIP